MDGSHLKYRPSSSSSSSSVGGSSGASSSGTVLSGILMRRSLVSQNQSSDSNSAPLKKTRVSDISSSEMQKDELKIKQMNLVSLSHEKRESLDIIFGEFREQRANFRRAIDPELSREASQMGADNGLVSRKLSGIHTFEELNQKDVAFPGDFFDGISRKEAKKNEEITIRGGQKVSLEVTQNPSDSNSVPISKILHDLPYEYASNPNVERLLRENDPAHLSDSPQKETANMQEVKEVLAALEYAKKSDIVPESIHRGDFQDSREPGRVDFRGVKSSGELVLFDPFRSPEPLTISLQDKAKNIHSGQDENFSKVPLQKLKGISLGMEKAWAEKGAYEGHTNNSKGVNRTDIDKGGPVYENQPVTGIWDQTYSSPEKVSELESLIERKQSGPGNVDHVRVKIEDSIVWENMLVEKMIHENYQHLEAEFESTKQPSDTRTFEQVINEVREVSISPGREPGTNVYTPTEGTGIFMPTEEALSWRKRIYDIPNPD